MIAGDVDVALKQIIADKSVADNITNQNTDVKSIMVGAFATRAFIFNNNTRADGNTKESLKNARVRQAINLLIDEADFDYSQTIDLAYYYDDQTTSDIMQMLVQDFAEAGVTLNPYLLTGDLAAAIYTDMNYDILYAAGSSKAWNQSDFYNSCYSFMGLDEERGAMFDDLMNAYNATADAEERKELSWQMQVLNYENNYIIPLYFMNEVVCCNTANVELPEDICAVTGNTYMRWEDWTILN